MTPQEKAVIDAANRYYLDSNSTDRHNDLMVAVEALIVARAPASAPTCGYPSPTAAMTCHLKSGHVMLGLDRSAYRYHEAFAKGGTRRIWREWLK